MIDYKKLYSELSSPEVSPEMAFMGKSAERSGAFRAKHPEIFDADHPLAFGDAQNTAQKAKDKSDELQEAFKAASEGNFESLPKFDTFQKSSSEIEKAGGYKPDPYLEQIKSPGYVISGKDAREAHMKDAAARRVAFARGYGKQPSESDLKAAGEMSSGFAGFSGAGFGSHYDPTPPPQTHSSNVARYGYTPQEITPEEQKYTNLYLQQQSFNPLSCS